MVTSRFSTAATVFLILAFVNQGFCQPQIQWTKTFGTDQTENASHALELPGQGFIIAGGTFSEYLQSGEIQLLCLNQSGDSLWSTTFGGDYEDVPHEIYLTNDNQFAVAGRSELSPHGINIPWITMLDADGSVLWTRAFGDSSVDLKSLSATRTLDGGFVLMGAANFDSTFIIRADSEANLVWLRYYEREGEYPLSSVMLTSDGGFVVAGSTSIYGEDGNWSLMKVNEQGLLQWHYLYPLADCAECTSIEEASDGGLVLGGIGDGNFRLLKTDRDGIFQWTREYDGGCYDECYSVKSTDDDGFLLFGINCYCGTAFIVKADVNGDSLWSVQIADSSDAIIAGTSGIAVGGEGFLLFGNLQQNGEMDYWVSFSSTNLSELESSSRPTIITCLRGYPNPFNSVTTVEFKLQRATQIELSVYDVLGRLVVTPLSGNLPSGNYRLPIDASGWSSGTYFCRLQSPDGTQIQKIILEK